MKALSISLEKILASIVAVGLIMTAPGLSCYEAAAQQQYKVGVGSRVNPVVPIGSINGGLNRPGLNSAGNVSIGDSLNPAAPTRTTPVSNVGVDISAGAAQSGIAAPEQSAKIVSGQVVDGGIEQSAPANAGRRSGIAETGRISAAQKPSLHATMQVLSNIQPNAANTALALNELYEHDSRGSASTPLAVTRSGARLARLFARPRLVKAAATTTAFFSAVSSVMADYHDSAVHSADVASNTLPWLVAGILGIGWVIQAYVTHRVKEENWWAKNALEDKLNITKRTLAEKDFKTQVQADMAGVRDISFDEYYHSRGPQASIVFSHPRFIEEALAKGLFKDGLWGQYKLVTEGEGSHYRVALKVRNTTQEEADAFRAYIEKNFPDAVRVDISRWHSPNAAIYFANEAGLKGVLASGQFLPMSDQGAFYMPEQEFPYQVFLGVRPPAAAQESSVAAAESAGSGSTTGAVLTFGSSTEGRE